MNTERDYEEGWTIEEEHVYVIMAWTRFGRGLAMSIESEERQGDLTEERLRELEA